MSISELCSEMNHFTCSLFSNTNCPLLASPPATNGTFFLTLRLIELTLDSAILALEFFFAGKKNQKPRGPLNSLFRLHLSLAAEFAQGQFAFHVYGRSTWSIVFSCLANAVTKYNSTSRLLHVGSDRRVPQSCLVFLLSFFAGHNPVILFLLFPHPSSPRGGEYSPPSKRCIERSRNRGWGDDISGIGR